MVVTVFDQDRIADYQKMVAALRSAGIRAELYLGSGKFGAQMKYADRRGSPCAVIQGGDEKAKGEVQIKDLILGGTISSIKDRDEYKAKQAEAQFAVPEADLLDGVRRVLTRHGVTWDCSGAEQITPHPTEYVDLLRCPLPQGERAQLRRPRLAAVQQARCVHLCPLPLWERAARSFNKDDG